MDHGACTPEELELLLEDALVLGDMNALANLFEDWAVLAGAAGSSQVRGTEIAGFLAGNLGEGQLYLAGAGTIIQARNRALVVTGQAANVVRRGRDGAWRYEIFHLLT